MMQDFYAGNFSSAVFRSSDLVRSRTGFGKSCKPFRMVCKSYSAPICAA
jgi:hypothetical protein